VRGVPYSLTTSIYTIGAKVFGIGEKIVLVVTTRVAVPLALAIPHLTIGIFTPALDLTLR